MARMVKARRDGFYGGEFRKAGSVFGIAATTKIGAWMEALAPAKPAPAAVNASGKAAAPKEAPAKPAQAAVT